MNTTRTRQRITGSNSLYTHVDYDWGVINDSSSNPRKAPVSETDLVTDTEVTHDCVTPQFRRKSASGLIILNDYKNTKTRHSEETFPFINHFYDAEDAKTHGGFKDKGTLTTMRLCQGGLDYLSGVPSDSAGGLAVTAAHANIDNARASILVTLAEVNKTAKLIHDSVLACKRLLDSFNGVCKHSGFDPKWPQARRLKWKRKAKRRLIKAVSDAWLTYRYGVRPLVYDCRSIMEAATTKPNLRFTAVGKGFDSLDDISSGLHTSAFSSMNVAYTTTRGVRDNWTCGIVCEINNPFLGIINHWGIDDIASTVWELIPYSFVIDWFSGIRRFFSAADPKIGVKVKGKWLKRVRVIQDNMFLSLEDSYINPYYRNVSGSGNRARLTLQTSRWTNQDDFPPFSFTDQLTSMGSGLDWKKTLDLIALVSASL